MKILPKKITKNGFTYLQEIKTEKIAIYSQYDNPNQKPVAFEVFEIKISKAGNMKLKDGTVVEFEEKERFPGNEDFGKWAWTYKTWKSAFEKHKELELKLLEDHA